MQWLYREYLPCFTACQALAVFSKVVNSPNIFLIILMGPIHANF